MLRRMMSFPSATLLFTKRKQKFSIRRDTTALLHNNYVILARPASSRPLSCTFAQFEQIKKFKYNAVHDFGVAL